MKKIFLSLLAVATIASCTIENDEKNQGAIDGASMEFGSGISVTRVAADALTFEDNDLIKVVGYETPIASGVAPTTYGTPTFAENFKYNLSETKFASDDASSVAFWHLQRKYFFYAYYPASVTVPAATDATTVTLPAVTSPSAGIATEVLYAATGEVDYPGQSSGWTKPALTFNRKLSKIRFRVQFDNGYTDANLKLQNISFKATNQGAATMNLFTGALTPVAGEVTYTLGTDGDEAIAAYAASPAKDATDYNALAWAPMIYAGAAAADVALSELSVKIDGQVIPVSNTDAFTVQQGQITYVLLTVKRTGIEFSATINAWETGAGASGEVH